MDTPEPEPLSPPGDLGVLGAWEKGNPHMHQHQNSGPFYISGAPVGSTGISEAPNRQELLDKRLW